MKDCIFCKISKGEIPCNKVLESENFMVFADAHPRTKGHSLVIPKEHFETFLDVPQNLYKEFLETTRKATEKILKENSATGFNLATNNKQEAGQVVPHFHLHIIPRKNSDGLKLFN